MQSGFDNFNFRDQTECADLAVVNSRPTSNIILDVMKQSIRSEKLRTHRFAVIVVFGGMNELCDTQKFVAFAVRFCESGIVGIVVVHVEQYLIDKSF